MLINPLAPVVKKMDSAIHWINHYPSDKYQGNQLRYPAVDSDLSGGQRYSSFDQLAPDGDQHQISPGNNKDSSTKDGH